MPRHAQVRAEADVRGRLDGRRPTRDNGHAPESGEPAGCACWQ
ncbi:hypothetical protein BSIN_2239 [Burkholderia singularis]|uniref:Uncharacterized protein n=1 Tax=Burkholderia singularis TaxID=1503053 RepID=A0A238H1E2_9BURK|nr:hypothetical protein BSIN_2239 [Burkholderia singularis]